MLKINLNDNIREIIETKYYKKVKEDFIEILNGLQKDSKFKKLMVFLCCKDGNFNETKLMQLLIGKPDELEEIISEVGKIKVKSTHKILKFYKTMSRRQIIREILKELNVNVCPYCNRMYTITLEKGGVRPQLDHYYPKNIYPYLSVSLYNLIPSCSICNQKKSSLDPMEKPILNPYKEEFGSDVIFEICPTKNCYKYIVGESDDFEIKIKCLNPEFEDKINNLKDTFAITEIYNKHKEYVIDILRNLAIYNQSQLDEYYNDFPKLFNKNSLDINEKFAQNDDKEIYSFAISNPSKESWGNRPFGKLEHDIYKQFQD